MIFKKRTFYGDEPERQVADHPAELERRVAHLLAVTPGLDAADVTVTAKGNTIVLAAWRPKAKFSAPKRRQNRCKASRK
ncbi:hypothetical protein SAMN05216328_101116 [Ensifer sp. YR511]|nr:hypothetical protein SAMN05216328_101116 [Ensifer sp. YR511]